MRPYYDPAIFNYTLESLDRDRYVTATYYVEDTLPGVDFLDHFLQVERMAIEGSTGSWMEVREETPEVRERLSGKVLGYYEIPAPDGTKKAVVQLGFPIAAWEANVNVPMLLLSIAGNCFAYPAHTRLLDVYIPESVAKKFRGPKFGVEGIRKMLGVEKRPLVLQIIKPKMGMTPQETAHQVYETAMGGVDMVKDDEMCSEVYNCSFDDRLAAVTEALHRVQRETGRKVLYFISVTDEVDRLNEKARKAVKAGASGLLLAYSAGPSALKVLSEDPEVTVPILLHVSHMLALLPRISFVVLAKLMRLCGADMMLTPSTWSSIVVTSLEESLRTVQVLGAPFYHIRRTWGMPAGGMHPGLAPVLVREHGFDLVIPSGGGILGHRMGYRAGAKAWRQALDAVVADIPLEEAAADKPELRTALDQWGTLERPSTPWGYLSPTYRPKTTGSK